MDADIQIHRKETLSRMLAALENGPEAHVAVDRPRKDISFNSPRSLCARLSLGMSRITGTAGAQVCAQLYCIRAGVARNIYMPRDLPACDDGFIKALVCTDFLTRPVNPERICLAEQAEHTFEAYTSPAGVFRNQKRQIIGQTVVHILVDRYLNRLPVAKRRQLAAFLRAKDQSDPNWLKRLIRGHLQQTRFAWQLHPGLLSCRFRRWTMLSGSRRFACAPALAASSLATLAASIMAHRHLKAGYTRYWPSVKRLGLNVGVDAAGPALLTFAPTKQTTE